ncbi:Protein Disulfide Isomerase [Carpediemonas membranifera]|uniref:Protein Disulfide Isomerase n=1 Tax=Carpediemonas membranifera TaxID=201153 RepID=A0A8J6AXZ0_9EUKA|nr:Protein Disulfide Isomerase [Carpediemonas membranifera]|eukprot:KAG9391173.1 Protein Disulfide Isomerase [Carpediemonas membranifera]
MNRLVFLGFVLVAAVMAIDFVAFEEIQNDQSDLIVSFLDSSNELGEAMIKTLETLETEELFNGFRFVAVDKVKGNEDFFATSGFGDAPLVFITTEKDGIDRVEGTDIDVIRSAMEEKRMEVPTDSVVTLTSGEAIENILLSEKPVIIKCFEQWCGHCKHLAPTFAKAGKLAENAIFAEVECSFNDETKAFCDERGVRGFPTVVGYANDQFVRYQGARNVKSLVAFVDELAENIEGLISQEEELKAAEEAEAKAEEARHAEEEALEARWMELMDRIAELEAENKALKEQLEA